MENIKPGATGLKLIEGDLGIAWKQYDSILSPSNPLMFTCKLCGKTSVSGVHNRDDRHNPYCIHSGSVMRIQKIEEQEKLRNALLSLQV